MNNAWKKHEMTRADKRRVMQNLVLLGILTDGPMHGYEVRKEIEEKLKSLVGVRPRSVYYALDKLEKEGFLTSYSARSGKRPKKFVYKITRRGREELKRLLVRNMLMVERPYFNLDLSLYFLKHIDTASFEKTLRKRLEFLQVTARRDCVSTAGECSLGHEGFILKISAHSRRMLKEEIKFTKALLADLKQLAQP